MRRIAALWDTFWFEASFSARILAFLRITFSLIVLYHMRTHPLVTAPFFGGTESSYFADGFYSPYFNFLAPPPYAVFLFLSQCLHVALLLALAGFLTSISLLVSAGISLYLFMLNKIHYHNHFYSTILVLFLLGFSPCAKVWSIDARLKGGQAPSRVHSWAVRLLQVTVSLMYLASAASKTIPSWLSGKNLEMLSEYGVTYYRGAFAILKIVPFMWQAIAVVGVEYFLAVGLWCPKLRRWAIVTGILFHICLGATMSIGTFSWQMAALYLVFLRSGDQFPDPVPSDQKGTR